jgi:MoaA/NifB/PqqE/SkfB family radical SAM enzyme
MNRDGNNISYLDFVKYANRLKEIGVKGIILEGGGEPTICPDFEKMTQYLDCISIPYIILTNFNEYREVKPEVLRVSLDAWSEDTYKAKRGVSRYNKVRDNIIRYAKWRDEHSPDTEIGIQLVTCDTSEILPFYEGNKDLPVDYITIKPYESTNCTFYDGKDDAIAEQNAIIKALSEKDSRIVYNYKWRDLNHRFSECYAHANQIGLRWDGAVMCCCHRPYDVLGNIMDEDILVKNRQTRFDMSKCDVPCRLTGPNTLLENLNRGCKNQNFI